MFFAEYVFNWLRWRTICVISQVDFQEVDFLRFRNNIFPNIQTPESLFLLEKRLYTHINFFHYRSILRLLPTWRPGQIAPPLLLLGGSEFLTEVTNVFLSLFCVSIDETCLLDADLLRCLGIYKLWRIYKSGEIYQLTSLIILLTIGL